MGNPVASPHHGHPRRSLRKARSTVVGIVGGLGALLLALTPLRPGPRPSSGAEITAVELLQNGRVEGTTEEWGPAETGYERAPSEGRSGSQALRCATPTPQGRAGAFQTLKLDRTLMLPLEAGPVTSGSKDAAA